MVIGEAGVLYVGGELTTVQSETAAATIKDYYFPFGFQVLEWGVMITEDFTDHTLTLVVKLQKLDKAGGTVSDISILTVDASNTSLKRGDGVKEAQTAITADTSIDNGQVVFGPRSEMPARASASQILRFAVTTATGSAGGAITPFAFVKPILDARASTVWIDTD